MFSYTSGGTAAIVSAPLTTRAAKAALAGSIISSVANLLLILGLGIACASAVTGELSDGVRCNAELCDTTVHAPPGAATCCKAKKGEVIKPKAPRQDATAQAFVTAVERKVGGENV